MDLISIYKEAVHLQWSGMKTIFLSVSQIEWIYIFVLCLHPRRVILSGSNSNWYHRRCPRSIEVGPTFRQTRCFTVRYRKVFCKTFDSLRSAFLLRFAFSNFWRLFAHLHFRYHFLRLDNSKFNITVAWYSVFRGLGRQFVCHLWVPRYLRR